MVLCKILSPYKIILYQLNKYTALLLLFLSIFFQIKTIEASEWELAKNKDGIKVFTRIIPGCDFKATRAEADIKTSISGLLALLDDIDSYYRWYPNLKEIKQLKRISKTEAIIYQVFDTPWPIDKRDSIIKTAIVQDPETKVVTLTIKDDSKYLPEKPDKIRIKRIDGFWKIIPKGNGFVKLEYQIHSEPGGMLPAALANAAVVERPFVIISNIRKLLKEEKYKKVRYNEIKE